MKASLHRGGFQVRSDLEASEPCVFKFSSISLMKLSASVFGIYTFSIVVIYACHFPLMNINYPSVLLLARFCFNSILLDS